jgi:antitoxin PrlF
MTSNTMRVKVTRSFQVTIPREVREALGIRVGDYLEVRVEGSKVVMERVKKRRRVLRSGRPLTIEEIDEIIARGLGEMIAGGSDRH